MSTSTSTSKQTMERAKQVTQTAKPQPQPQPKQVEPPPKPAPAESDKWKHLVAPYLRGNGIELATGGSPIVPTSIQFELSPLSYAKYNSLQPLRGPVQWRSDTAIFKLPFKDGVLDYVASSHLLEDYLDWVPLLTEWVRVLKPGGRLVICLPDKKRWAEALAKGQPPNCAHRHESYVGELSGYASRLGLSVVADKLTNVPPGDYNILYIGEKM
jgi:SAM-dependent methyltransferase